MSFKDFVKSLQAPSFVAIAWGFVESQLLEWWPAYHTLSKRAKKAIAVGFAVGAPLAALVLDAVVYGAVVDIDQVFGALLTGFLVAFPASQIYHVKDAGRSHEPLPPPIPDGPFTPIPRAKLYKR